MTNFTLESLYKQLKSALYDLIQKHKLSGKNLQVRCRVLETSEAIGTPEDKDYPIQNGREHMIEAVFENARGQAFADEFENINCNIETLITMETNTNAKRAIFIAGLNAVYRYCSICEKTVHCRDEEPKECASHLSGALSLNKKIALIGLQPRFLEQLTKMGEVRVLDLDTKNIGQIKSGILIEPPSQTSAAIDWCDHILATGSTIVNGSIISILQHKKPTVFFGVTISAAAEILGLETFCKAPIR